VFLSPSTTRAFAYAAVEQLPSLLSPAAHDRIAFNSKMLWPLPEPAKT
jgi:hypothetical protein